jgi:hypothetical protein
MKTLITSILLVAALNVNAVSPVSINRVQKLKFLVEAETGYKLTANIYDSNDVLIHTEYFVSKKLFNFANLSDGAYRLEIKNERKEVVSTKLFQIISEVKREVVSL